MLKTHEDIDLYERWWVEKSRKNFLAYRQFMRHGHFKSGWFINQLCRIMQQFYVEFKNGSRPVYIINTPPQHGKSWTVTDFISWVIGLDPTLKIIFASYADRLGTRCNKALQRTFEMPKYGKIFPDLSLPSGNMDNVSKNSELIEFWEGKLNNSITGYFRNTTVNGAITGDSLDLGFIDDPVKGRKEARSKVISESVWEWWEDDFSSRFSEFAGVMIVMTRWVTHDMTGRLLAANPGAKLFNFQALNELPEPNRPEPEMALFPELKSKEFLLKRKSETSQGSWGSLYQGNPTVEGGNLIKDHWWEWWDVLPSLQYKFITGDTAQKDKEQNDYSDFKCWGVGRHDGDLYLLDHIRGKWQNPELRREVKAFYNKHNIPRINLYDPSFKGMYIEDKSSGTGLIQDLRAERMNVHEVPRNTDKYLRVDDASPYIEQGRVHLNENVPYINNTTMEAREFPNGEFDDDLDSLITAVEVTYINRNIKSNLAAAMMAD